MGKKSNFKDIKEFHRKFGLEKRKGPVELMEDEFLFRFRFIEEELEELLTAWNESDLPGQIDALVDISVVVLGTAERMGIKWQHHWNEVHRANMSKERSEGDDDPRSKRASGFDIVKPEGWVGPDHEKVIKEKY